MQLYTIIREGGQPISSTAQKLSYLSATAARKVIAAGEASAEELTRACLERINAREDVVGAWIFLDEDLAIAQARDLDARQKAGETLGPLHGLSVGLKDIFDTADMPTECGSALCEGRTSGGSRVCKECRYQGSPAGSKNKITARQCLASD